jgi:hypothetical protein
MIITELRNKKEAQAFLSALNGASNTVATERPYAAHLVFLVTGLELDQANMLLEALHDLDAVTGPYVACHVFVDRIKTEANIRLVGFPEQRNEEQEFTIRQIEGLCNNNSLNHIELEDLAASDLTSASEQIARTLGIVEKLPCILVFDACEMASSGEFEILPFPNDINELSKLVRKLVSIVAALEGKFREYSCILESLHILYEQRIKLRTELGAPISHKLKVLNPILDNLVINPSLGFRELKRVRKSVGIYVDFSESQIACLNNISEPSLCVAEREEELNEDYLKELANLVKNEFELCSERVLNVRTRSDLTKLREIVIEGICQGIVDKDTEINQALESIDKKIIIQRELLTGGASLSSSIRKDVRIGMTKKAAASVLGTILKSGLSDVAKPSFWLKILGL